MQYHMMILCDLYLKSEMTLTSSTYNYSEEKNDRERDTVYREINRMEKRMEKRDNMKVCDQKGFYVQYF